ncbi:hypothetical protein JTB14_020570 [Gonioctena quinquepunctata]|nr:hypothetical protein JTB14_020570 [Gonioctena quinquepunctata]
MNCTKIHSVTIWQKLSLPASFLPKKESPAAPVRVNIQDAPQKPVTSRISNNIELEQIDLMNKIIYQEDNYQATNGGDLDDGYAYPRRRNNRHYNHNNINRKPEIPKKYIGSSKDETDFTGKKPKVWLYIYRVTRNVNDTQIQNYISKKLYPETPEGEGNSDVVIKELQTDPNQMKCFMIGADLSHKEKLYTADFWPSGVGFRRFDFRRYRHYEDNQMNNRNSFL